MIDKVCACEFKLLKLVITASLMILATTDAGRLRSSGLSAISLENSRQRSTLIPNNAHYSFARAHHVKVTGLEPRPFQQYMYVHVERIPV